MNIRQVIAAGAVALICAQAVFAADAPPAGDRCKALEAKFDKMAAHSTAAGLEKAKAARAEGAQLCSSGKAAEGAKKLHEAIKMLGAPAAK